MKTLNPVKIYSVILVCLYSTISIAQSTIEEITVTAQKREQNVQDVSIAINAFSGDEINRLGIDEPLELSVATANLNIRNSNGGTNPIFTIRGVGLFNFTSNITTPIGVYVDDGFVGLPASMSFSLFDLERVEVLKGPQGTLFGRNTTGGLVHFISAKPVQEAAGKIKIGYGNYDNFEAEAMINGPLSNNLSARLATHVRLQGKGYYDNTLAEAPTGDSLGGDGDRYAIRAGLRWEDERNDIILSMTYGQEEYDGTPFISTGQNDPTLPDANPPFAQFPKGARFPSKCGPFLADVSNEALFDASTAGTCSDVAGYSDTDGDPFTGAFSNDTGIDSDFFGIRLRANFEIGNVTFTSITSYDTHEKTFGDEFDGGPFRVGDTRNDLEIDTISQEIRLGGSLFDERLDWITGIYYSFDELVERDVYGYTARFGSDIAVSFDQEDESFAVYTHGELRLDEAGKWTLIGAARYTDETIKQLGFTTSARNVLPGGGRFIFIPIVAEGAGIC